VDEPNKDPKTVVEKFYDGLKNYETKKLLEDLVVGGMTVKEFLEHGDKDYREFEYGKPLVPKYVHLKAFVDHAEIPRVVLSCMCL
jgi:hypothetical protein